jgi:hypothetical protein
MKAGLSEKRNVTPQQAIKILEQNGLKISEKEAEEILDFLYFLGKLSVNQYFNKDKKTVI